MGTFPALVGRTVYLYLPDHHTLIHSGGLLGAGPVCWPSEPGDDVALIVAFYPLGQCSVSVAGQVRLVFVTATPLHRAVSCKAHTERLVGGALDMAALPGGPAPVAFALSSTGLLGPDGVCTLPSLG